METLTLERASQPTLTYAVFTPKQEARGAVLLTTGFSEHIGRYEHVAEAWSERGFLVVVYDLRGQGNSEGRRAFVTDFHDYVSDALELLDALKARPAFDPPRKPILFGHSIGALISAHVALSAPDRACGLALSSPFFAQALPTAAWKKRLGRLVSGFWPTYMDTTNITGDMLTHDAKRARAIDADPMRLPRVSARWFTEIEAAQARLYNEAPRIKSPVFCIAAGDDKIASLERTREVFERLGSEDRQLVVAEGKYHELHQELNWNESAQAFADAFERLLDAQMP